MLRSQFIECVHDIYPSPSNLLSSVARRNLSVLKQLFPESKRERDLWPWRIRQVGDGQLELKGSNNTSALASTIYVDIVAGRIQRSDTRRGRADLLMLPTALSCMRRVAKAYRMHVVGNEPIVQRRGVRLETEPLHDESAVISSLASCTVGNTFPYGSLLAHTAETVMSDTKCGRCLTQRPFTASWEIQVALKGKRPFERLFAAPCGNTIVYVAGFGDHRDMSDTHWSLLKDTFPWVIKQKGNATRTWDWVISRMGSNPVNMLKTNSWR